MTEESLKLDKRIAGDLFADPETSATVLHTLILTAYGDELYGDPTAGIEPMDPVELFNNIDEDFNTYLHENNENKINAIMTAVSTDIFYEDPQAFIAICMALYDGDMGDLVSGMVEQITVPEILWGIYEVELNRDDQQPFAPMIVKLIDQTIAEEAEEVLPGTENAIPYFEHIISFKRNDMFEEMRAIGIPEKVIRRLSMEDITPRHDESGDLQ